MSALATPFGRVSSFICQHLAVSVCRLAKRLFVCRALIGSCRVSALDVCSCVELLLADAVCRLWLNVCSCVEL